MQQHTKNLWVHRNSKYFRVGLYAYTVFILIITLIPLNYFKGNRSGWLSSISFEHTDKVVHFMMFFIMGILLYFAFQLKKTWYFYIPVLFGILVEILQYMIPSGRSFDLWDILADAVGALIVCLLIPKQSSNS